MKIAAFLCMLLLVQGAAALSFSEILFNPLGNDNGKEYVELIGSENLAGCQIRDTASADQLTLQQQGDDHILILETDSSWIPIALNATLYTIGSAIGNGLGNTYEELNISCNGTLLASTRYNASEIAGFKEGMSIMWNGGWTAGEPTPGYTVAAQPAQVNVSPQVSENSISENRTCEGVLLITVSNTTRRVGELLTFTIITNAFASFSVLADKEEVLSGDTLNLHEYSLTVPNATQLRITAQARACDARLHAARGITVLQPEPQQPPPALPPEPQKPAVQEYTLEPVQRPELKGEVIMDKDRSAIPWICGFGASVLLISSLVFWKAKDSL
jgi:hypothetical protein